MNLAVTSTIHASVASTTVIAACFVHSWGGLSGNSSSKLPELTSSWCLILRTVQTNGFVDNGGLLLRAVISLLSCSLQTAVVHYTVNWPPFASIRIYSHPLACCILFLLLQGLRTIFNTVSWVMCLVAVLPALWWTNLYLHSCCVPRMSGFHVAPANRLVFDPLWPSGRGCVSIMRKSGLGEEDDNER